MAFFISPILFSLLPVILLLHYRLCCIIHHTTSCSAYVSSISQFVLVKLHRIFNYSILSILFLAIICPIYTCIWHYRSHALVFPFIGLRSFVDIVFSWCSSIHLFSYSLIYFCFYHCNRWSLNLHTVMILSSSALFLSFVFSPVGIWSIFVHL